MAAASPGSHPRRPQAGPAQTPPYMAAGRLCRLLECRCAAEGVAGGRREGTLLGIGVERAWGSHGAGAGHEGVLEHGEDVEREGRVSEDDIVDAVLVNLAVCRRNIGRRCGGRVRKGVGEGWGEGWGFA